MSMHQFDHVINRQKKQRCWADCITGSSVFNWHVIIWSHDFQNFWELCYWEHTPPAHAPLLAVNGHLSQELKTSHCYRVCGRSDAYMIVWWSTTIHHDTSAGLIFLVKKAFVNINMLPMIDVSTHELSMACVVAQGHGYSTLEPLLCANCFWRRIGAWFPHTGWEAMSAESNDPLHIFTR